MTALAGKERKMSLISVRSGAKATNNWDFASHLVFAKYDTYIARVQQVKVLHLTIMNIDK